VIRRVVRLTFRMHRFEVGAVVVMAGLAVAGSVAVSWALGAVGITPACASALTSGELPESCVAEYEAFNRVANLASPVTALIGIFPVIAGLLIGGPVVSNEIERGTTALAWSMSPSRLRWYLQRVVPLVVVLLVAGFAVGVAADHLHGALNPTTDLSASFQGFRFRGVLLAIQAFVICATAIAAGALLGRAVPTFLLSLVLGLAVLVAVGQVHQRLLLDEATIRRQDVFSANGDLYIDNRFELPDGRFVTGDELINFDPAAFDGELVYPIVGLVIPGERYRAVEAREGVVEAVIALAFLAGGALIVARRRPS
jgi:hypothetical protein